MERLSKLYLHHRDSIALEYVDVPKLTLSEADHDFFVSLLDGSRRQAHAPRTKDR